MDLTLNNPDYLIDVKIEDNSLKVEMGEDEFKENIILNYGIHHTNKQENACSLCTKVDDIPIQNEVERGIVPLQPLSLNIDVSHKVQIDINSNENDLDSHVDVKIEEHMEFVKQELEIDSHFDEKLLQCSLYETRSRDKSNLVPNMLACSEEKYWSVSHGKYTCSSECILKKQTMHHTDEGSYSYSLCRICGYPILSKPHRDEQLYIIGMLAWWYKELEFDQATVQIGTCCSIKIRNKHRKAYSYWKTPRKPKHVISIAHWNYKDDCPYYNNAGKPLIYSQGKGRCLKGRFRGKDNPIKDSEIAYSSRNVIEVSHQAI